MGCDAAVHGVRRPIAASPSGRSVADYAIFKLDADGCVPGWNHGAGGGVNVAMRVLLVQDKPARLMRVALECLGFEVAAMADGRQPYRISRVMALSGWHADAGGPAEHCAGAPRRCASARR